MMAKRKISLTELSEQLGMTMAALSRILDCQPGDLLEYREDEEQTS